VRTSNEPSEQLHGALHRLPGMPAHDRAAELNSNAAAARWHHRRLPNRPLRNRPLRNRPLGNRGSYRRPRALAGWQARIGRLFGQARQ
jgi:hypothetical protein